ncbi:hypothetical protein C9J85_13320 [Haloferax sp. wsp5]|nr:hypothetical protein C9J85_13320 [Haloferax sp. wsp5]
MISRRRSVCHHGYLRRRRSCSLSTIGDNAFAATELGVGLDAVLADVEPFLLVFGRDACLSERLRPSR